MTRKASLAACRRAVPELRAALADHPDVRVVGLGSRMRGGAFEDEPCLVVGVEKKGAPDGPPLPREIDLDSGRYPVDVRETPARAFRLAADGALNGSDRIRVQGGRNGTLGLVLRAQGGALVGLTCAHVVGAPGHDARARAVTVPVNGQATAVASVAAHADLSVPAPTDLAALALNPLGASVAKPYGIDMMLEEIQGFDALSSGIRGGAARPHYYVGDWGGRPKLFECTGFAETPAGTVFEDASGAATAFGRSFFFDVAGGGVKRGHSGSALFRRNTAGRLVMVGLIFAGARGVGFAFSWTDIRRTLAGFGVTPA